MAKKVSSTYLLYKTMIIITDCITYARLGSRIRRSMSNEERKE